MVVFINHILLAVYRAGAQDVDERSLRWSEQHYPAIDEAMRRGFLIRMSDVRGSRFSLTRLGYTEIGVSPPPFTKFEILKRAVRFLLFVR